jgi:hypothetical protein
VDLSKLAAEISADPLAVGYADMADSAIADSLNAPTRSGKRVVPASEVRSYVLLNGLWPRIQALTASTNPIHQGSAVTILQTLAPNSFDTIRMNDPAIAAAVFNLLSTMVTAGALTEEQRDAMVALGDAEISRAEELGLPPVHHLDVAAAKALIADAEDNGNG